MTHTIDISALLIGVLGVAVFNLRARGLFHETDARIRKYSLFKVRDDLIRLVAEEKLREDGFVFQYFYDTIDCFIRHTDQINLKSFVQALRQAQENGLDPANNQEIQRIQGELNQQGAEVRRVVSEFYATIIQILIENSRLVRLTTKHADFWRALNEVRVRVGGQLLTERLAYSFYKAYRNAAQITAHAA